MTVKLMLNKDRMLKTGKYPLVFQVIHLRRKKLIYTTYKLHESEFDAKTSRIVRSDSTGLTNRMVKEMNSEVEALKVKILTTCQYLEKMKPGFSVDDLMEFYQYEPDHIPIQVFIEHEIKKREEAGKYGSSAIYQSTLNSLNDFMDERSIYFPDLNHQFIRDYSLFLEGRDNSPNTVCFYLRNFRAIYNLARMAGIKVAETSPFEHIPIRMIATHKRALSREVLSKIAHSDLSKSPGMELARDLFMFSFYTRGMSLIDILYLRKKNIVADVITYKRSKTKQFLSIGINEPIRQLIDKYNNKNSEYVFPLLNASSPKDLYTQYRSRLGSINYYLKKVAAYLKLSIIPTTYAARHSWATLARESGVPIAAISAALGHTKEETTLFYLKQLDRSVLDAINEELSKI